MKVKPEGPTPRQRPIVYDIMRCEGLPHTQKYVLLILSSYGDEKGKRCHPSLAKLAQRAGYSKSQVQRMLRLLKQDGLICEVQRTNNDIPVFDINHAQVLALVPPDEKQETKPLQLPVPPPPTNGNHPRSAEPVVTPPRSPLSSVPGEKPSERWKRLQKEKETSYGNDQE